MADLADITISSLDDAQLLAQLHAQGSKIRYFIKQACGYRGTENFPTDPKDITRRHVAIPQYSRVFESALRVIQILQSSEGTGSEIPAGYHLDEDVDELAKLVEKERPLLEYRDVEDKKRVRLG